MYDMMPATFLRIRYMSKRLRRLIESQPQIKVAQHAQDNTLEKVWFVTLAAVFAGAFYFFGYYFLGTVWHALTGG